MRACDRHKWRYSMCDACTAANQPYQLTGLQRVYLEGVRAKITVEDLPEGLRFDDEGTVIPSSILDQVERIVRGEVS